MRALRSGPSAAAACPRCVAPRLTVGHCAPHRQQSPSRVCFSEATSVDGSPSTAPDSPNPFEGFCRQVGRMSHMAVAAFPIANITSGGVEEMFGALSKAMEVYLVLLTVRVLLSWFRNINWHGEPFASLRQFTDPYLSMFRGIIPTIGGMDLSPMIGFFLLSFAAKQFRRMSLGM